MLRNDARIDSDEGERLSELRRYDILDTPPEASFDRLTALAARVFGVPIVLISLLDESRQWFKSCYGFDARETALELAFCRHTILSSEVMVVPDARLDPRFRDNPLVTGAPSIHFYAGAPLLSSRGYALGTLCLIDARPRNFGPAEREMLKDFAALVLEALEFRLAAKNLKRAQDYSRLQSEEQERLFTLSHDLFCITDASGHIKQLNPAWRAVLGYHPEELLERSVLELVHPEDLERVKQAAERLSQGQRVAFFETRFRAVGGSYRWLSWSGTAYFEEGRIYAVARDVSERKEDEERLKRYSKQITTILKSITDAFFSLDKDWRFSYLNPQAERLFRRSADELLGRNLWRAFPQVADSCFEREFTQAVKTHQPVTFEEYYAPLELWLEVHAYPSEEGLSVYVQDITERKASEQALKHANELKDKVVQSVREAIFALDPAGNFTLANGRLYEMLGRDGETLDGTSLLSLFPERAQDDVLRRFGRALAGEEVAFFETEFKREGGSLRTVNLSLCPLLDEGKISGVVATAEDITETKRALGRLRLLEKAVEHIGEAVLITDAEIDYPGPRIVYANEAFLKQTGYSREEVLGKTPRLLQGPKTDRSVLDRLRQALLREESFAARAINYRKDGSSYLVEWHIAPVRDDKGRIGHWASVQRDITERTEYEAKIIELNNTLRQRLSELDHKNEQLKTTARLAEVRKQNLEQAAAELANTARQLHTIFALSPDGFVSVDEQGGVAYVNDAFLRMTGLRPAQLIGLSERRLDALIAGLCDPALPYHSYLVDAETFEDTLNLVRPRPMILKRTVRTLFSEDGELLGRVIYLRDITHESEVDRMKSEFLSTTAHELRTPMTSIYGFSQLLLARNYDPDTSRELIKTIHDQSARLGQLLNELLDLARIEARAGKDFKISLQPIHPIIEETLRGFNVSDKHELIVELPEVLPQVAVDADKMQQVLTNILSNALKYSPEGGVIRLSAKVCERENRRQLGVITRDEGIGMTREQLARVFERFYRADTSGSIPGTGLGMSLVKEIVELHGGSIELESAPGEGTAVIIWLPLGEEG